MFRREALLAIILLFAVSLVGCGGNQLPPLPSAAEAQKAVCDALTSVNSSVAALGNLNPNSAVNEVKALRGQVDTWVQAIKAANTVLNRPAITDLTNSYDDLALKINSLADGQTLGATAEAQIEAGVASMQAALTKTRLALSCP